jgi:hypothetical protein
VIEFPDLEHRETRGTRPKRKFRIRSEPYLVEHTVVNQAAVEVAKLAQRMTSQYFSHVAAMYVARDRRAEMFAPSVESGQLVPILRIRRRDGNDMKIWFNHYLAEGRKPEASKDFDRVWLTGALLTVGDAIGDNGYFNHDPEAEIIRHLRNGIAHGNHFDFRASVIHRVTGKLTYPANIFRYSERQVMPRHEIATHLQDTEVLWGWGGPDAIIDCLTVLGIHLWNVGHGLPLP